MSTCYQKFADGATPLELGPIGLALVGDRPPSEPWPRFDPFEFMQRLREPEIRVFDAWRERNGYYLWGKDPEA